MISLLDMAEMYIPEPNSGCWLWLGRIGSRGYGTLSVGGRSRAAHKYIVERVRGPVAPGMVCDHKCRTRLCVNPDHIRIVTPKINTLENSVAVTAINAAKTHCSKGHEFTSENTRIRFRDGTPRRICWTCQLAHARNSIRKIRASSAALNAAKL